MSADFNSCIQPADR